MLPAGYSTGTSLADVLSSSLAAITGGGNSLGLAGVERAVVILVDGMGSAPLRARSGHARFLAPRLSKLSVIEAGFPTTTASALATLCTGTLPGQHGMVGYRVRDQANNRVVNELSGWDNLLDPETWQSQQTIFERARGLGVRASAIGQPRYATSGFTRAVLRGAEYVPAQSIEARFAEARRILDRAQPSLTYLYISELDMIAHAKGWESVEWLTELELVDALIGDFASRLAPGEGVIVTADHGVLDVPHTAHVLFDTAPALIDKVELVGGEPRCLQLYLADDATDADRDMLAAAWRDTEEERAWIATRSEALDAGWFGPVVAADNLPRIGDVIVAARKRIAYYDSRDTNSSGRSMIGQHGSLTADELRVPLIRLGDFEAS